MNWIPVVSVHLVIGVVCSTSPEATCIHTDEFAALRCGVRRAIVLPAHPQRRFTEPGHSIHATPVSILILQYGYSNPQEVPRICIKQWFIISLAGSDFLHLFSAFSVGGCYTLYNIYIIISYNYIIYMWGLIYIYILILIYIYICTYISLYICVWVNIWSIIMHEFHQLYCQAARRRCPERSPVPRLQAQGGKIHRKCGEHAIRENKRGGPLGGLALMSYRPPNIRPKTQNDIINSQTNSPKWKNSEKKNNIYI